jgi:DNA-binding Lrp family transcriptional regulator
MIIMARVDAAAFVEAWVDVYETGGNQSDVAKRIGTSSANVSTRAKKLREAGVDLPELVVNRSNKIDVDSLNERLAIRLEG